MSDGRGYCAALAAAVVRFMSEIGKGFSPLSFGDRFEKEVRDGCSAKTGDDPGAGRHLKSGSLKRRFGLPTGDVTDHKLAGHAKLNV
jgi:hypothetical protein